MKCLYEVKLATFTLFPFLTDFSHGVRAGIIKNDNIDKDTDYKNLRLIWLVLKDSAQSSENISQLDDLNLPLIFIIFKP